MPGKEMNMKTKLKMIGSYLLEAGIFLLWIILLPLTAFTSFICKKLEEGAHGIQDWRTAQEEGK